MDSTLSINLFRPLLALLASASLVIPATAQSKLTPPIPDPPKPAGETKPAGVSHPAAPAEGEKAFVPQLEVDESTYVKKSMDDLERLVAPVALYPDELLAQVLPSATSPLDVVKAHQFLLKNPDLKEPPAEAVQQWDPAVVSLMQFPDVIEKMAGDIKWTTSLGEAVFFQEQDVYDAIQLVRSKAHAKGMLVDNDKQIHLQESEVIRIEPSDPQVIYVPQYEPEYIYVDRPVRVYDPYITYSSGVHLGWGLCWAFDWHRHRCIPHHHWYYTWHHHRYHCDYGRPYYGGHHPPRPRSVCPPGGRPPRPHGWKPRDKRDFGWRPPRPSDTIAGRLGDKRGSGSAPGGTVWKPRRPVGVGGAAKRPGRGESALVGNSEPSTPRLGATSPGTPTQRPGSGPGSSRTGRANTASNQATGPSNRTGTPGQRPGSRPGDLAANRPGNPSAQGGSSTIQPATSNQRPGSRPGTLRTSRPGTSVAEAAIPASRPGSRPSRSVRPSTPAPKASTPTPRSSSPSSRPSSPATPRPGSRIASNSRSSTPSSRGTSSRTTSKRPSSSGIRLLPLDSTYQRNVRPIQRSTTRPSSSSSRSVTRPSPSPSRPSITRSTPSPSRSVTRPSPSPSRSSITRSSPSPSRSTYRPSPSPSRSSSISRPSRSSSRSSSRPSPSRSSSRPSPSRSSSSRPSRSR